MPRFFAISEQMHEMRQAQQRIAHLSPQLIPSSADASIQMSDGDVVIVEAVRTPLAKRRGAFKDLLPEDLLSIALKVTFEFVMGRVGSSTASQSRTPDGAGHLCGKCVASWSWSTDCTHGCLCRWVHKIKCP